MRKLVVALSLFAFCGTLATVVLAADEKPKHTIKQVMKVAMKDGLCKKVAGGKASQADKNKLLDAFLSLLDNKPPKGDAASWNAKAGGLVIAAAKIAVGRKGGEAALKKAANCGACHKAHKGK
ncbi:MAG: hypothetical protein CL919_00460 [Deltaproteobacteria bacterium]|nr:hypothetical protein [Deltaproteobacteria bacterium]